VNTPQPEAGTNIPEVVVESSPTPPAPTTQDGYAPGPPFAFTLRAAPSALASTRIHPSDGCSWLGIAGQAFDLQGVPIPGLQVNLGGTLNEQPVSKTSLTGTEPLYGEAGFEIVLAREVIESAGTLWVQLADQANLPISDQIHFDTFADCERNLLLINFIATR
jgi:hypothetical protein